MHLQMSSSVEGDLENCGAALQDHDVRGMLLRPDHESGSGRVVEELKLLLSLASRLEDDFATGDGRRETGVRMDRSVSVC